MSALTVAFSAGLAFKFKKLEEVLEEHLQDNLSEVLPHLLMGEYCSFTLRSCQNADWLKSFLNELEERFSEENDLISELIAVSFIENIPYEDSNKNFIVDMLGEEMRAEYNRIFGIT